MIPRTQPDLKIGISIILEIWGVKTSLSTLHCERQSLVFSLCQERRRRGVKLCPMQQQQAAVALEPFELLSIWHPSAYLSKCNQKFLCETHAVKLVQPLYSLNASSIPALPFLLMVSFHMVNRRVSTLNIYSH